MGLYLTSQVRTMKLEIMGKWLAILGLHLIWSLTENSKQWYISINASFNSSE